MADQAINDWQDTPLPNHLIGDWQDTTAPGQMTGASREVALPLSNLAGGIINALSAPSQFLTAGENAINKYVYNPLLGTNTQPQQPMVSNVLHAAGDASGITNRPDLQPQNTREKYEASAMSGIGSALPFGAGAIASGAGSGLGQQAGEDMGLGPWGQFFTSMAGGLGAGGLTGVTQRLFNRSQGNLSSIAQAYKDIGMTPTLGGNATDSSPLKFMQNVAQNSVGGSGIIKDASEQEMQNFGNATNNFASQFGKSKTMQDAGTSLQQGGKQWLANFKNSSGKAWDAVDNAVGSNTPAALTNTESTLSSIKNQAPQNPQLQKFLGSKLAGDIDGIITEAKGNYKPASFNSQGLIVPSSGNVASPVTWSNLKSMRSRIGEYLSNPDLISDAGTAQAKQLYGALSQDMKNTALTSGNPQALPLLESANTLTKNGHDFIENTLSGITEKGVQPEDAAKFALSGNKIGGSNLAALRQEMPDATDELAAYKIRDAAQATAVKQNAAGNAISPSRFLAELGDGGKMSPEALSALIPEPADKSVLDSMNKVAGGLKKTESVAYSNKEPEGLLKSMAIGAGGLGTAGHAMAGVPGAMIGAGTGAALPLVGGYPMAKLATSPFLANLMSGAAGSGSPSYPALAALAMMQQQHKQP